MNRMVTSLSYCIVPMANAFFLLLVITIIYGPTHTHTYTHIHTHTHTHTQHNTQHNITHTHTHTHTHAYIYIRVWVYVCMCMSIYMYVCVCMCVRVCLCACVFTYISPARLFSRTNYWQSKKIAFSIQKLRVILYIHLACSAFLNFHSWGLRSNMRKKSACIAMLPTLR